MTKSLFSYNVGGYELSLTTKQWMWEYEESVHPKLVLINFNPSNHDMTEKKRHMETRWF